jgi:hypothetical protein
MAAFGWVKSSDVGQIDWTSVVAPTGISQVMGYEVWAMADTLQATYPVYLKIQYGSGGAGANYPAITLTPATGYTGSSGTMSGQIGTAVSLSPGSQSGSSYASYVSGTISRATMFLWGSTPTYSVYFTVERSLNASALNSNAGIAFVNGVYGQSNQYSQFIPASGTIPDKYQNLLCLMPPSGTTTVGNNVYVYPIRIFGPGENCPILGFGSYLLSDIAASSQITVLDWAGNPHNYYTTPSLNVPTAYGRSIGTTGLVILYE